MARRRLLMPDRWSALLSAPTDEENLIRYYTLSADDLDRTLGKREERNQLGFAVQLCLMRHPGRLLGQGEAVPAPVLTFIADQLGVNAAVFPDYGRRDNTRREHAAELQQRLGLRTMTREDQRAALVAAINAATPTDKGEPIAAAVMEAFRKRQVLLPSANRIDRIGTAGRAFARKRAQTVLLEGYSAEQLSAFENLLTVDPTIKQTRFGWLRSHPEAPGDKNLLGLIERLEFVRSLPLDPTRRQRIHPDRWRQMVREGEITPSWLAADFNANRRRATIVAQLIELAAQLSDAAIGMFNKQIGRLFTTARAKAEQRHLDTRKETAKALRLFRDTLRALAEAKESGEDALDVVDERVGWHRLLLTQPTLEAMVETADPAPLLIAAERYVGLRRYAPQFLDAFTFR
jgi:hypothetical protein